MNNEEDMIKLFYELKNGDMDAREKIINANIKLVYTIAHQYKNMGVPIEDLISEGTIGLVMAVDKFDVIKGAKFSVYAIFWIKQRIFIYLSKNARVISIGRNITNKMSRVKKIVATDDYDIAEIAKEVGSNNMTYIQNMINGYGQISMNEKSGKDEKQEFGDSIFDENDFVEDYTKNDIIDYIKNRYKEVLTKDEAFVFENVYFNDKKMTQSEIATHLDVTRQRVQQLGKTALEKIKELCCEVTCQK